MQHVFLLYFMPLQEQSTFAVDTATQQILPDSASHAAGAGMVRRIV